MRIARHFALPVVATAVLLAALSCEPQPVEHRPIPVERITEDDPGWDCRTMGNQICGPPHPTPGPSDEHTVGLKWGR